MIQANELRVGNWVKLIDTDRFYTVSFPLHNDLAEQWHTALDYCEPIPLTPEILEKCGFEQYENTNGNILPCWRKGKLGLEHRGKHNIFTICWYDADDDYGTTMVIKIVTLHQLQNLYYALTGTELTITL